MDKKKSEERKKERKKNRKKKQESKAREKTGRKQGERGKRRVRYTQIIGAPTPIIMVIALRKQGRREE